MYNGDTLITFGKYKFTKLKNLPKDYLLQLFTNKSLDKLLLGYIERNLEEIKQRDNVVIKKEILDKKEIRKGIIGCYKIGFPNKKEANFALRGIRENPKTDKVPIRSYECEICGAWHHTSLETFKH